MTNKGEPIAISRNGLKIYKPLKSYTPLKAKKPMNKVSIKQKAELKLRHSIKTGLITSGSGLCQKCHKPPDWRGLQLHHDRHLSQGGKTTKDNLILLCASCHAKEHHIVEPNVKEVK